MGATRHKRWIAPVLAALMVAVLAGGCSTSSTMSAAPTDTAMPASADASSPAVTYSLAVGDELGQSIFPAQAIVAEPVVATSE